MATMSITEASDYVKSKGLDINSFVSTMKIEQVDAIFKDAKLSESWKVLADDMNRETNENRRISKHAKLIARMSVLETVHHAKILIKNPELKDIPETGIIISMGLYPTSVPGTYHLAPSFGLGNINDAGNLTNAVIRTPEGQAKKIFVSADKARTYLKTTSPVDKLTRPADCAIVKGDYSPEELETIYAEVDRRAGKWEPLAEKKEGEKK